jgi:uncharacterized repeat protein (TIGR03803 family)
MTTPAKGMLLVTASTQRRRYYSTGHRWELLRDNMLWRGRRRRHDLQNHAMWQADNAAYLRRQDGEFTAAALVQDTNGKFYGTAPDGGAKGDGTVFSLSVGLGPFVETQPTSGKVGAAVKILGTDLTGATSVTFNGTAAVFKVVSASLITTNVPTGATTGTVEVTTPKGTLKSNVVFRVTK